MRSLVFRVRGCLFSALIGMNVQAFADEGLKKEPSSKMDIERHRDRSLNLKNAVDHIRVVFNRNPSVQADIMWKSLSSSVVGQTIFFGTEDKGLDLEAYPNALEAKTVTVYNDVRSSVVTLKGLLPKTTYYFVVKDENRNAVSKRYYFTTMSDSPNDPLYVVAGGDSRNNREVRRRSNLVVKALAPDVVFFGGDFTSSGKTDQWNGWFDDWTFTFGDDGRVTPIVTTRGNHEYSNSALVALFNTPSSVYYDLSFHGNLLNLYVLNTEISISGNQLTWLSEAIKKSPNYRWNMSIYHKPMRPHTSWKSEGFEQSRHWAPLFYEYGMDLVVESDTHMMKVTWPIRPDSNGDEGFVRDDARGTVYVGEGSWGAPLRYANDDKSWTRASARMNQVKWIEITSSKTTVRTVGSDNAYDLEPVSGAGRFDPPKNLEIYSGDGGEFVMQPRQTRISRGDHGKNSRITR